MLLLKLWAEVGLCNKAMGEVKRLIYQENIIPQSLLIAVLVKFAVFQKCDLGHDLKETFNLFIYLLKQF